MNLSGWQTQLDAHFRFLRDRRTNEIGKQPLFALEHGRNGAEIEEISESIRQQIKNSKPSWEHRLPWVIYAAELGYLFSGDQYWQTFEQQTPGWEINGDRHWIRKCFLEFQKDYNGAQPTGRWARHRRIICWPITHAILPKDLQRQFAKLLFQTKNLTSYTDLESLERLGRVIQSRSYTASPRFQQLAQEPLLVGQIAKAFLHPTEQESSSFILPSTLARIEKDLEQERQSKTWLNSARENAARQIRISRGIDPNRKSSSDSENTEHQASEFTKLDLEPHLLLRPSADKDCDWDVLIELPDFSTVLSEHPEIHEILNSTRCQVTGSSGRPLATGQLLYGPQQIALSSWPPEGEVLLQFKRSSPELDYLLQSGCFLSPSSARLFKIGNDRLAREIKSKHVRAGHSYILVSQDEFNFNAPSVISSARLRCDNIYAVLLYLPDSVDANLAEQLASHGVHLIGDIQITPAGLTPSRWNGEGHMEWLHTDSPCLSLKSDHYIESFSVQLDKEPVEVLSATEGHYTFVEMRNLGVGHHTLSVSASGSIGNITSEPIELGIQIREPRISNPGNDQHGPLLVIVEPYAPSLEQLWGQDVEIEIHGPAGRLVECTLSLFERDHTSPSIQVELLNMPLPVTTNDWHSNFDAARNNQKVQNSYDAAYSSEIKFSAGELGIFTVTCEREFIPLRWASWRTRDNYFLRVLDDTGSDSEPEVSFYAFEKPDYEQTIDIRKFQDKNGFEAQGGLYMVRAGDHNRAIVAPSQVRFKSFHDLNVHPKLQPRARHPAELLELVQLIKIWSQAHLTADVLSDSMRRQVLGSISQVLFSLLCGRGWEEVERAAENRGPEAARNVMHNNYTRYEERGLAAALVHNIGEIVAANPDDRTNRLTELFEQFFDLKSTGDGPNDARWCADFSLRLTSQPERILDWAGNYFESGLSHLLEFRELARAARFMVLLIDEGDWKWF